MEGVSWGEMEREVEEDGQGWRIKSKGLGLQDGSSDIFVGSCV